MPTVSFDISSAHLTRFTNSLGNDYQSIIADPENPGQTIPNPETKAHFAKRKAANILRERVLSIERDQAFLTIEAGLEDLIIT